MGSHSSPTGVTSFVTLRGFWGFTGLVWEVVPWTVEACRCCRSIQAGSDTRATTLGTVASLEPPLIATPKLQHGVHLGFTSPGIR